MKILVLFSGLFLLVSCNNLKTHNEFTNINSIRLPPIWLDSIKTKFNIIDFDSSINYLGGLKPKYPLVRIFRDCAEWCEKDWQNKGMICGCFNYLILKENKLEIIKSKKEFRLKFFPIEDYEEALSYTIVMTNSFPIFDETSFKKEYIYFNDVKTSNVIEHKDGYFVQLFDYKQFGCGEHPYFSVSYNVTKAGVITEISKHKAFKNPANDGICVD